MKRGFFFLLIPVFVCTACLTSGGPLSLAGLLPIGGSGNSGAARKAGANESEIRVQRAQMPINSGFKERIYIDGVQKLVLDNGESGTVIVPKGDHTIYAELYTLTTERLPFSAGSGNIQFVITPYSLHDFAIELMEGGSSPDSTAGASYASVINDDTVEGSLARAAERIMTKLTPNTKVAIVYVTARDGDIAEYIAQELEFIMVDQGFTLIDRSQLDRIRREQNFQLSGEVDDEEAVSVGKIAGANIIITGAVTGTGDLRRLRLRALDTQTAQVVIAASERY